MRPGRVHLVGDVTDVAAPVSLVHGQAEDGFDEAPMVGNELFRAGYQAARRIVRPVTALQQILGEMSQRARIGDNACRPPPLEFPVVIFKYFRRESEAVEAPDVVDEANDAGA